MYKAAFLLFSGLFFGQLAHAQVDSTWAASDTLEATITAPFGLRKAGLSTAIVRRLLPPTAAMAPTGSLVHLFNTVPGVRLEERSPGSYRLNIRGSSLRAPFGVRNVKVYYNQIPLTDPGGNTYFNQLAANSFTTIHLHKGPAASLYGAGTGGLVDIATLSSQPNPGVEAELSGGSYGLINLMAGITLGNSSASQKITLAHTGSQGYRAHTRLQRTTLGYTARWQQPHGHALTATVLASHLLYQTPGGLTEAEYQANPRQARPRAGTMPGAQEAKAGISQQNLLAGLSHQWAFSSKLSYHTVLYGAFARIKNPAIRNLEQRLEPHAGLRTWLQFTDTVGQGAINSLIAGLEYQLGFFNTQVFANVGGQPGLQQSNTDLRFHTGFAYLQAQRQWRNGWLLQAGASLNNSQVRITPLGVVPASPQQRSYRPLPAPRLLLQYQPRNHTTELTISRGYSPPTVAELLPSTGQINTALQPEQGWNFELSHRRTLAWAPYLQLQANAYWFELRQALVQNRDAAGADFFVNAGRVRQSGLELLAIYQTQPTRATWWQHLQGQVGYSWQPYSYRQYVKLGQNLAGKQLPGIARHQLQMQALALLGKQWHISAAAFYNSALWFNDANTAKAPAFWLLNARLQWKPAKSKATLPALFAGVENLLDARYTQAPDINAAGGRYWNVAPGRLGYLGVRWGG